VPPLKHVTPPASTDVFVYRKVISPAASYSEDEEKAAMKARAKELKADAARGKDADAENMDLRCPRA
jgi:hypothetical protein